MHMKTSPESFRFNQHRALNLLAAAVAFLLFGFASSSCTSRHELGASAAHSPGITVEYDLPNDYLSAKYRQLYRTDPDWFHNHHQPDYYGYPAGK
jgi:hypothetical protein